MKNEQKTPRVAIEAAFTVGTERMEELYSLESVVEAWGKVVTHAKWQQMHEVSANLKEVAEEIQSKAIAELKATLLGNAFKRLLGDQERVAEALIAEIKEYYQTVDTVDEADIKKGNEVLVETAEAVLMARKMGIFFD